MKVYVDMDGVIADFFGEATKLADNPTAGWRNLEFRDVEKILKKIGGTNFFGELPMFPGTNTLLTSIVNIAGGFSICSSPLGGDEANCERLKRQWLTDNLIHDPDEVIITKNKPQFAKGNILIDDYGHNIVEWEKAGGYGIKYQADEDRLSDVLIPLLTLFKKSY